MLMLLAMLVACNGNDGNDPDTDTSDVGTDSESSTSPNLDTYDWSGDITLVNRVEDPAQADYTLSTEAELEGTLTIQAGVRIAIEPTGAILVNEGSIRSNGTAEAPVILDGGLGLILRTGSHTLTYTEIRDAATGNQFLAYEPAAVTLGLDNLQATATFDHVTIADSNGVGLFVDTGSSFTATGLSITGSTGEYAVVTDYDQLGMFGSDVTLSGALNPTVRSRAYTELESATTFDFPSAPVVMADDLDIVGTGSLILAAGTELRFPAGTGLYATGALVANGTAEAPVILRSTAETAGSWDGVRLMAATGNTLTYTEIRNGGGDMDFTEDGNLVVGADLAPSTAILSNVTLANSAAWGMVYYNLGAAIDTSTVTFTGNASGDVWD